MMGTERTQSGVSSDMEEDMDSKPGKALPRMPPNAGPPTVPLTVLIDYAVQRTYQDLTVLTELLPKKNDMERKLSIVQFARSTRQLFIRLLALVKWIKSSGKVNACTAISYFLDEQCAYFVDTADKLAHLAREELTQARLPAFQIPAAVDVLTLGSYPRLPVCIKSRFVPEDVITKREEVLVLQRLNQVIQYRLLSTARPLPGQLNNVVIRNGMAKFRVPREFEASLTILGELPATPWTLLDIKILVQDFVIGDGTDLVHPMQLHYLHQVIQARMSNSDRPITELYRILHRFCLGLQLDVLFCQIMTLIHERLKNNVSVDLYRHGEKLLISYWKQNSSKGSGMRTIGGSSSGESSTTSLNHQISIEVDPESQGCGLVVKHTPSSDEPLPELQAHSGESREFSRRGSSDEDENAPTYSIEALLTETTVVRARQKLRQIQQRLETMIGARAGMTGTAVPSLTIPILSPSDEPEDLSVAVNVFTGRILCEIKDLGDSCPPLRNMEKAINDAAWNKAVAILANLRMRLLKLRCKKTLAHLPIQILDHLPLALEHGNPPKLPENTLFLHFSRYEHYYMILGFRDLGSANFRVDYHLEMRKLLVTEHVQSPHGRKSLKAKKIVSLDPITLCPNSVEWHQPVGDLSSRLTSPGKRRMPEDFRSILPEKRQKKPAWYIKELAVTAAICKQRIPFFLMEEGLRKKDIRFQATWMGATTGGVVMRILSMPNVSHCSTPELSVQMWRNVLACNIRLQYSPDKRKPCWTFECQFANNPLAGLTEEDHQIGISSISKPTDNPDLSDPSKLFKEATENPPEFGLHCQTLYSPTSDTAEKCLDEFLNAVCAFGKLYHPVCRFAEAYRTTNLHTYIKITKYRYARISFCYGPEFGYTTVIKWSQPEMAFHISFGVRGNNIKGPNPHQIMSAQLHKFFNTSTDLVALAHLLHETTEPLLALQELGGKTLAQDSAGENSPTPGLNLRFLLIPISETVVRLVVKGSMIMELAFFADGVVGIRDCCAGIVPAGQIERTLIPIHGLRAFINRQMEESEDEEQLTTN